MGAATPSTGPLTPGLRTITAALLAMVTVVAFESMAVSTAMPAVAAELEAMRGYGLAFSAMLTAQLLGIVLAGVWTDRQGPLPGTFAGQLLVGGGSALCGVATNYPLFLAGRIATGLGGGLLVVMLYVIAARVYTEAARPRLFALISAAWVLPSLTGPAVSAWLTDTFSWRWVFLVVVPPCVATFAFFVAQRGRLEGRGVDRPETTDGLETTDTPEASSSHLRTAWVGLALALAAGAVQYGTATTGDRPTWQRALAVVGLVGIVLAAPRLLPVGTWRMARGMPSVMLSRALLAGTFYAGISYVPLMLVTVHGRSLLTAGGLVAVGSLGWFSGSWWQGRLRTDFPRERLIVAGGALLATGLLTLAACTVTQAPWWLVALPLAVAGVGMGLGITTTAILALALSRHEEHGEISSSLQIADVLGSVLGLAAASAAFAAGHSSQDAPLFAAIFAGAGALAAVVVAAGQRIRT